MDIELSGNVAKQVIALSQEDIQLAESFAKQIMDRADRAALVAYLITDNILLNLLAEKIKVDPVKVLKEIQAIPPRTTDTGNERSTQTTKGKMKSKATKKKPHASSKSIQRKRLGSESKRLLMSQLLDYLGRSPGSSRKQIRSEVRFTSTSTYNRTMAEAQEQGWVVSKGNKAMTVYFLGQHRPNDTLNAPTVTPAPLPSPIKFPKKEKK